MANPAAAKLLGAIQRWEDELSGTWKATARGHEVAEHLLARNAPNRVLEAAMGFALRWTSCGKRPLGHKRIDETMLYVDFAKSHGRPIREAVLKAGQTEQDPDRRVVKMLGARRGTLTAPERTQEA